MKGKPAPKRWRRLLIGPAIVAVVIGLTWLVLREMAYSGRLPPAVKERMPAHWRIPWGLPPDMRDAVEGLYSPDGGQRALAAHQVGNFGAEAAPAIPHLMALLADEEPYEIFGKTPPPPPTLSQRIWAWVESLAPPPKPKSYEEWWELKHSGDTAAEALADIGPAAVEPLLAALKDPLPRVRARAAAALGLIGDPRATEPLAALANTDEYTMVRWYAVRALGTSGDPQAVPPLVAWLKKHSRHSFYVAPALVRTGDERAVAALRAVLSDNMLVDNPSYVELALLDLGPRGVEAALERQGNLRVDMAYAVAEDVNRGGTMPDDPRLFDLFAEVVNQKPNDARQYVYHMVKLGPKRAVDPLLVLLQRKDLTDDARSAVITALSDTRDDRALQGLLAALKDAGDAPRPDLEISISSFHAEVSREMLLKMLARPDDGTQGWAGTDYWAWSRIKDWRDPRIVPLFAARHDKQLLGPTIEAMVALGPAAVEPLLAKLSDPDPEVRQRVARALGEIGDARAFEPLLAAYLSDPDSQTRIALGGSLARLHDPRPVKFFLDEFNAAAPQGKRAVLWNLGYTKDPAALDVVYHWWQAEATQVAGHPFDPFRDRLGYSKPDQAVVLQDASAVSYLFQLAGDGRCIGPWVTWTRIKPPRTPRTFSTIDLRHGIEAWGGDFKSLAGIGGKAVEPLTRALAVDSHEVQTDAAAALAVIGDEGGLKALWEAWPALHFEVRRSVAAQLGRKDQVDPKRAWGILVKIASEDRDRIVRKEAFRQLAKYADKASLAAYLDLVKQEPCPTVREFARLAIHHHGWELQVPTHQPLSWQYGNAWQWPADDGGKVDKADR